MGKGFEKTTGFPTVLGWQPEALSGVKVRMAVATLREQG